MEGCLLACKSIENRPKINRNAIQNRTQIDQKSGKNRSKSDLGGSVDFGGGSGGLPGASWAHLGALWVPSWRPRRPQNGAKMVPKSMQKTIKTWMVFEIDFWSEFGGFLEPKWSQVEVKTGQKIDIADKTKKPTKR